MVTSENINEIASAGAKAQLELQPAIEDAVNPHFGSKYADYAAIREAARVYAKHGIASWQDATSGPFGVSVVTRLTHSSGQWMEFGPLVVPCAKADAHGVGSATTYAKRYALSAALGISSDDDDDGNAASERTQNAAHVPERLPAPRPQQDRTPTPPRQASPAADGVLRVTTAKIAKEGRSAKGQWTLYAVKLSDGREATTFSATLFAAAQAAAESGVHVEAHVDLKNGKLSLVSLEPVFLVTETGAPAFLDDEPPFHHDDEGRF